MEDDPIQKGRCTAGMAARRRVPLAAAGLGGLLALLTAADAPAVLFHSTGDPSYNTTPPGGTLTNSGWQFVGQFNYVVGVPVAPHYFLTCQHWNGVVGDPFVFRGETYTATDKINDPGSDLTLFKVDRPFPAYAALYTGAAETGQDAILFGRGADRGAPVPYTNILFGVSTNGWQWGARNHVLRWGANVIEGTNTLDGFPVLRIAFDIGAGSNECMLADQDSGGAAFLLDGGVWKLAGVAYAVFPHTFSYSADGSNAFQAAMYEYRRFYYLDNTGHWVRQMTSASCEGYLSRVSSRLSWITNQIPDFDTDADGLPDAWEQRFGGDPLSMLPGDDADADGDINLAEWVADSDPTNGASRLRIAGLTGPADLTISFDGSTGRLYRAEFLDDLAADAWQAVDAGWYPGMGSNSVLSITNAAPAQRQYRLGARVP